jgi:hypothetical protein
LKKRHKVVVCDGIGREAGEKGGQLRIKGVEAGVKVGKLGGAIVEAVKKTGGVAGTSRGKLQPSGHPRLRVLMDISRFT